MPDLAKMAEEIAGARWWAPSAGIADVQACAVVMLTRKLAYCYRHGALIAACLAGVIRTEAARRVTLPGTVEVRHVLIEAEPFEQMSAPVARREGVPMIERVRAFVNGSQLSAIIEVDLGRRRARITFQLHDGGTMTGIESDKLVHLSASELVTAIRAKPADRTG